ncbi:aspartyl-tRNA(Asn)/glutamyl-tRNA(Gln) amidotransferase subunit A [Variovorax boronicumulans]|uniref:Aspartyl-tRNA(Asn)/glutamyl-tRNA(Gln) amidotransferase subunit A n=1 Tax=Variovorax boronicumulans TaxID=436515 RepID=A0AAW8E3L5_9BURK|nr:amidase [Variovorax boronicumulans]MDP9881131.1 aspartyl-tRNA(Asn)/glutamyl-tRNA(Gln) amidotransferase subunit A [Variovorax boronicumulans]MDP9926418.1 aspartyl-tRNA(Asn)/glutamyl-tRNA(Gln) amidotransferase subunit A [Variovorax boronicumulans]
MPAAISLEAARADLAAGRTTSAALTASALQRIADPAGEGARTFTRVLTDRAQHLARASDSLREAGVVRSPLEGLPVSVKDLFDVAGETTTAGSVVLRDAPPAAHDAEAVQRLLAAGAVLVGKTNMTEFAYSGLGLNPHYGTPANPWQRGERRIPGGSSSGAAVAVADGMCVASVGSDTGGSARIPAALCGITGFKPTARRMPGTGLVPLSHSLDAVGVMALDVAGCVAMDAVLSGVSEAPRTQHLRQARFAVPTTLVQDGMDAHVAATFQRALQRLSAAGAQLVELAVPEFDELAAINAAGGFSAAESWAWHAELIERSGSGYDPRVLSRILRGKDFTARAYLALQAQRADWQLRVAARLGEFDGWLMPTVPLVAPRIEALDADEAQYVAVNAAMLRNPSIVNFMDGCAISLPCHAAGEAPVGLSLAGLPMRDAALLAWAADIERTLRATAD